MAKKEKPAPAPALKVLHSMEDERKAAGITLTDAEILFLAKFVKALK